MRQCDATVQDLLAADHLPTCPVCGDLAFPGSSRCESCCSHLFQSSGGASHRLEEAATSGYVSPSSRPRPTYICPTCINESPDTYCDVCGLEFGHVFNSPGPHPVEGSADRGQEVDSR